MFEALCSNSPRKCMKSNNPFNILAARGEVAGVCVGVRDGPWASQHIMEMSWACQGLAGGRESLSTPWKWRCTHWSGGSNPSSGRNCTSNLNHTCHARCGCRHTGRQGPWHTRSCGTSHASGRTCTPTSEFGHARDTWAGPSSVG